MSNQQPQWQPVSLLPVFTDMVDGMLESSVEQLSYMQLVMEKRHVLDDATLDRIITLYSNQLENHWLFEEQFTRWKQGNLCDAEEVEIDRLVKQSSKLKEVNEEILKLARSFEHVTIDKIMAMDEIDLTEAMLSGKIKPPR